MKYWLLFLIISIAFTMALAGKEEDDSWKEFKQKFGKKHGPSDEPRRKGHFIKTDKLVKELNSKKNSWLASHNEFSDWSDDELSTLKGLRRDLLPSSDAERHFPRRGARQSTLPNFFDMRSDTCMQAIRNQGQCGSCWALAAVNALEYAQCKKVGYGVALSAQQLVSCDRGNQGCVGGYYVPAWDYIKQNSGSSSVRNALYPYTSGTTKNASTCQPFTSSSVTARVGTSGLLAANVDAIRAGLHLYGPIPAAINTTSSLQVYRSGIYRDATCTVNGPDHAVSIVGYGTDETTKLDYWIVRNTWGTAWGLAGYFLIQRGVNMCFIETYPGFVTAA